MSPVSRQVGIHMYSMDTSETESESATKEWVLKHVPEGQWVLQVIAAAMPSLPTSLALASRASERLLPAWVCCCRNM